MNIAFFLDVDNTLLDNDHIKEEMKRSLINTLGAEEANHFWKHHDAFRTEQKLVDFPKIIRAYCHENHEATCEMTFTKIFEGIEFTHALFPHVKDVLTHLKTLGHVSLFTEGDMVYQRMKIEKSGLSDRVHEVFLFEHKLDHLQEVVEKFKGHQKVFIDDRAAILATIRDLYSEIFTVEVLQGHYSTTDHMPHKPLDRRIDTISSLLESQKEFYFR